MTELNLGRTSGRAQIPAGAEPGVPLVVAVHGGTYDSQYFDVPGHSLVERAAANGVPIVALDRPGYGATPLLPREQMTLEGQGRFLVEALGDIWRMHGNGRPGMVIVAHSIGAAISLYATADSGSLPLLGISVSGVGMRTPAEHRPMWEGLPDIDLVSMPDEIKEVVMFGPPESFDPEAPDRSSVANRTAPKAELVDIVSTWHDRVRSVLARITVPVHYRQGEFDKLWIVDEGEVQAFADALTASSRVDAAMLRGTGHCLDFHHVGAAFQLGQLSFALQCAAEVDGR